MDDGKHWIVVLTVHTFKGDVDFFNWEFSDNQLYYTFVFSSNCITHSKQHALLSHLRRITWLPCKHIGNQSSPTICTPDIKSIPVLASIIVHQARLRKLLSGLIDWPYWRPAVVNCVHDLQYNEAHFRSTKHLTGTAHGITVRQQPIPGIRV